MMRFTIKHLIIPLSENWAGDKRWDAAITSKVYANAVDEAKLRVIDVIGDARKGFHFIFKVVDISESALHHETLRQYVRYAHGGDKKEAASALNVSLSDIVSAWRHGVVIDSHLYTAKNLDNFTQKEW